MRIATSQLFSSSLQNMEDQQSQLLQVVQQIASGTSLTSPADNPLGAAQAVQLSVTNATLTQYSANQTTALASLQAEGSTLGSVNTTLQSISSVVKGALNGSLNDSNRAALAQQLEGDREQLLSLANATDGAGNYLFSGFQGTSQVFTNQSGGGVTYNGDAGQRVMQVGGARQIPVSDSGAAVFLSVQAAGSTPVPAGDARNQGTGTIGAVTVTDPSVTTNNDDLSITFSGSGDSLTYKVTDTTTGTVLADAQPYTAGAPIQLGNGMNVAISGTPQANDQFTVTPGTASANSDVFATIDNAIAALQTPTAGNGAASATLSNALTTAIAALGNSLANVSTVQASVGGRQQEVQALQTVTSNTSQQTTTNLNTLTSTNMVAAISQYTQLQTALSASQKTFSATQSLSLFQYFNP